MKIFKILTVLALLTFASIASAQTLNVGWVAPDLRTDLTTLLQTEIATFRITYGTTSGEYSNTIDVNDPASTSTSIELLPGGTYYVTISVIDTGGRTSELAPEQSIVLDTAPPKSASGLTLSVGALPTP